MNQIYQTIAKEHDVTVAEVKKNMQAAIDYAYRKSNKTDSERVAQKKISYRGKTPTVEEIIEHIIREIR